MNFNDFTLAMNLAASYINETWPEEDKKNKNPLNINPNYPDKFIVEEIKKSFLMLMLNRGQLLLSGYKPTVSYKTYGQRQNFNFANFHSNISGSPRSRSFKPDIVTVNMQNNLTSYIEIKRIRNSVNINRVATLNAPMLFAPTNTSIPALKNLLRSNNYGDAAILSLSNNNELMTFYHEGQIFQDIVRLLNFRKNNEKLFFGAFMFAPLNSNLTIADIEIRIDIILQEFLSIYNAGNKMVFSVDNYNNINSWSIPNRPNFLLANVNGFTDGVYDYGIKIGIKNNYNMFGIAFEIQ